MPQKGSDKTIIDIRKVVRIGNMPAITLPKEWFEKNGGSLGDRVLIKIELLKDAKDIKVIRK